MCNLRSHEVLTLLSVSSAKTACSTPTTAYAITPDVIAGSYPERMAQLGYRDKPGWRDMSDFVVHFTRYGNVAPFDTLEQILHSLEVKAMLPFGMARNMVAVTPTQKSACFSEIPLDMLTRLVSHMRSSYGLGFHQSLIVSQGGGRVWYADKAGAIAQSLAKLNARALGPPFNPDDPFWEISPFIDQPGDYGGRYRFEWEREWRVPGGLTFTDRELKFVFAPEEDHILVDGIFEYLDHFEIADINCPIIDPLWPEQRIQEELELISKP